MYNYWTFSPFLCMPIFYCIGKLRLKSKMGQHDISLENGTTLPIVENKIGTISNPNISISSTIEPFIVKSRSQKQNRGGLGLVLLGYIVKGCFYFYSYLKLISICMFVSFLFIILCPLIPFLIPIFILILLVAVSLSIAIPLIVTASGGDDDLLLVTN